MKKFKCLLILAAMMLTAATARAGEFTIGDKTFMLNGEPFVVKAAEIHYPRIPQPYWEHRIKMCRALGMNTICIYVFWNFHEEREGEFDFTGQKDVAEFVRLCQKNGMYVIVRPGPYACAEWEMGGLPWWLLKKRDIRLREPDPYFMERVRLFELKVAEQLAPLTIQNGGPVLMVQVENEYGSYGEDKAYMSQVRDVIREGWGNDIVLFQCDWSSNFWKNGLDDLVWTMNFGTGANIDKQFEKLQSMRPTAPLMCSEFWSGWFDKWGARHETRPADKMVDGIDQMLSRGISFSLYMTHGGTSFGHWAGANSPGFAPDVTSYDYDAPINEWGQPTEKYYLLRDLLQRYSTQKLPAVPKSPMPTVSVPKFEAREFAPFFMAQVAESTAREPLTMEQMDCGFGMMLYETTLPAVPTKSVLTINEAHDYAQVYVDYKYVGTIDRTKGERSLVMPPVNEGQTLKIMVEAMGRINFGRAIKDFKGITGDVTLTATTGSHDVTYTLKQWHSQAMADSYEMAVWALDSWQRGNDGFVQTMPLQPEKQHEYTGAGYYRGYFNVKKVGDTFLNFEHWGKGQVWVNGHALGRIWSIGPQQTLYCPGCWLKRGKNEIIILDIVGPRECTVWGQQAPELNKLQQLKSPLHNDPARRPDLTSLTPVAFSSVNGPSFSVGNGSAVAAPGNGWQTFTFAEPQRGRYVAIEVLSTLKDGDRTAMAELYMQAPNGSRLSREPWTIAFADSEDDSGNHTADKVFDLQESTYWQTRKGAATPHLIVIDMGSEQQVQALEYLPRAEEGAPGGISKFRVYVY